MTTHSIQNELVAEFTKTPKYRTNHSSPLRWLASRFARYWPLGLMLMLGAFGNAALAAIVPLQVGKAFDAIMENPPAVTALTGFAWVIIISQGIRGLLQLGRNFAAEWLGQLFERDIRDELYVSLLGKSMTFHSLQPVGDTMARATNDVREINFMFNPGLNLVIGSGNFLILPLLAAPQYHPALMLAPALFIITYILAIWQYLVELGPITDKVRKNFGTLNTRLAEAIDGIETVKSASQEDSEVKLFSKNAYQVRQASVSQNDVEARFLPLLLMGFAQAGGLLHALLLYQRGLLTPGDVNWPILAC